jgi:hypothetical protein
MQAQDEYPADEHAETDDAKRGADDAGDPYLPRAWWLGLVRAQAHPLLQRRGREDGDDPDDQKCDTASDEHTSRTMQHVDVSCNWHTGEDVTGHVNSADLE